MHSTQPPLIQTRTSKIIFILYFFILLAAATLITPYDDAYYYWDWGRHLALSYYDGPPMIAYVMRIFTSVFGDNRLAINLIGVTSIFATAFFVYKTAAILFDQETAWVACLLWIFSPLVTHYLFIWVTYDNPLNLFWAATIYFVARYLREQQLVMPSKARNLSDLYMIGLCAGLLLLSKYTGVILLAGLLLFILCVPSYRALLRNKHFYFALLLAAVIVSPILIWNEQHQWISFYYQLSTHHHPFSWKGFFAALKMMFTHYNILLLLPLWMVIRGFVDPANPSTNSGPRDDVLDSHRRALLLLYIISIVFILFFLYSSFTNRVSKHWLTPFCITGAILCAYYLVKLQLRKLFLCTLVVYMVWSVDYIVSYSFFQKYIDGNMAVYELAKVAGKKYVKPNTIIVTTHWETAAKLLFWLPDKPNIYTLPCGDPKRLKENQYKEWSQKLRDNLQKKELNEILYLDTTDNVACMQTFFKQCTLLAMSSYSNNHFRFNKKQTVYLYAYQCNI